MFCLYYDLSLEQGFGREKRSGSFAENWSGRVAGEHELQGSGIETTQEPLIIGVLIIGAPSVWGLDLYEASVDRPFESKVGCLGGLFILRWW